jgi:carboxypeptidase PM20D1
MPPPKGSSAIGMMSAALRRLDDEQLPANIRGVAREMFETLAPEMGGFQRVALSNLWLFGPVVQAQLEKGASTNAMLRTTTALTVVKAGNKDNVIARPGRGTVVNFRLLPGDTIASVTEHVKAKDRSDRFELMALPGRPSRRPCHPHRRPRTSSSTAPCASCSGHAGGARPDGGRHRLAPFHRAQRPCVPLLAGARQARGPVALPRHQ